MTDVPGIVDDTVSQRIGTPDHNSILVNITTDFPVSNYTKSLRILIKSSISWDLIASEQNLIDLLYIYADECAVPCRKIDDKEEGTK